MLASDIQAVGGATGGAIGAAGAAVQRAAGQVGPSFALGAALVIGWELLLRRRKETDDRPGSDGVRPKPDVDDASGRWWRG